MKTTFFKLFAIAILITSVSCKKEAPLEFKHADKPNVLACEFPKGDLYKEAVFSFEEDIINLFKGTGTNYTPSRSYITFITNAMNDKIKVEDIASRHSYDIAQLLKNDPDIWNRSGKTTTLDYSAPFMDCIANNIKITDIKTTFNALLSTNSMRPKLILTPLRGVARQIQGDGSLKTFVAFEYFYSKLMGVKDPSLLKNPTPIDNTIKKTNQDNTTKDRPVIGTDSKPLKDPHAGHNH